VRGAKKKGWVDVWVGIDEDLAGGDFREIMRRMEVGKLR